MWQGVWKGPHWVSMKPRKGSSRACRSSKSVHLLGAWSFVVLSLRDVRGWEPVQPELPQELGDPAPRPSLLTLHLRGFYEHKPACPVGPLLGRDLSPGPGLPLTLLLQSKGGGLKFLPTRKMFRGDGHLAAGASSAPPQGQGPERSRCLCCCCVPRLGREVGLLQGCGAGGLTRGVYCNLLADLDVFLGRKTGHSSGRR